MAQKKVKKRTKKYGEGNVSKTLTKQTKKSYAIASCIATALNVIWDSDIEIDERLMTTDLAILRNLSISAMKNFNRSAGIEEYFELSKGINKIWTEALEQNEYTMTEYEIPMFVELLGYLLSPKVYLDYFKIPHYRYKGEYVVPSERIVAFVKTLMHMDKGLNELIGTKQYISPLIVKKVVPLKKVREAKPQKSTPPLPKKNKTLSKGLRRRIKKKEKISSFLQKKIAIAREKAKRNEDASE